MIREKRKSPQNRDADDVSECHRRADSGSRGFQAKTATSPESRWRSTASGASEGGRLPRARARPKTQDYVTGRRRYLHLRLSRERHAREKLHFFQRSHLAGAENAPGTRDGVAGGGGMTPAPHLYVFSDRGLRDTRLYDPL